MASWNQTFTEHRRNFDFQQYMWKQQHNIRRSTYTSVHSNGQMETNVQLEEQNEENTFCKFQRDVMLKTYTGSTTALQS